MAERAWLEEAEYLVKTKDLIIYIITHPEFAFDNRDDLEDLSDNSYTMLNQRLLTDAVENSLGDKNRFLRWVKNSSNILPRDIEMFERILDNYICDPKALLKANGFTADNTDGTTEEKPVEVKPETEEDDADFFTGGDNSNQELPGSIATRINDIVSNW